MFVYANYCQLLVIHLKDVSTNVPIYSKVQPESGSLLIFISLCQKLFQQLAQEASQVPQFTNPARF